MRLLSKLLIFVLLATLLIPTNVKAATHVKTERISFEDGSYIVSRITVVESRAINTKTGGAEYVYYSASDVKQWRATVTGTFTYDGTTATCTAVSTNFTVYASGWALDSVSKYKSGNKAIGDFYISCSVWETSVRVTLTCDKNGNLS